MDYLLDAHDPMTKVITLDTLTARADLECELWRFVKRPAGPHNARRREALLYRWRQAKRAARHQAVRDVNRQLPQ